MTSAKLLAFVAAALGGLVVTVILLNRPPSGPAEPIWDRDACAHCHMHLGERGFAAQALTAEGETLFFDDPGCLLLWQREQAVQPRAVYFHHVEEERWLSAEETGFVPATATPMNWGLAAVDAGTPGAIPVAEASLRLVARAANEPGPAAGAGL